MDIKVSAKINLSLDITGIMENGYHCVDTIIQSVDVYDTVYIEKSSGIHVFCPGIPEEGNTAYRAASAFFSGKDIPGGCSIEIEKSIPMAAGMGGSSSDAAAVLHVLNVLYGMPYERRELLHIASDIGADVPVLMTGGCQRCRGIGEIMDPVGSSLHFTALAVKGNGTVTSGNAYRTYDRIGGDHPDTEKVIRSLEDGDLGGLILHSANSLERACLELCPDCRSVMELFRQDERCMHFFLTGSGSAVIGIYRNDDDALSSASLFSGREHVLIHDTPDSLIIL